MIGSCFVIVGVMLREKIVALAQRHQRYGSEMICLLNRSWHKRTSVADNHAPLTPGGLRRRFSCLKTSGLITTLAGWRV